MRNICKHNLSNPAQSVLANMIGWIFALLIAKSAVASETRYLFRDEVFCSSNEELCIRGSLSYEVNLHLIRLRGRVLSATGPGRLRFFLIGTNPLGHRRATELELDLRGNHSEIINYKMIPDYPDIDSWEVVSIEYEE